RDTGCLPRQGQRRVHHAWRRRAVFSRLWNYGHVLLRSNQHAGFGRCLSFQRPAVRPNPALRAWPRANAAPKHVLKLSRRTWRDELPWDLLSARSGNHDHRQQWLRRQHRWRSYRVHGHDQRQWQRIDCRRSQPAYVATGGPPDSMSAQTPVSNTTGGYAMLGPLGQLMANPGVTEIMVMGARDIYVEVDGKIVLTPISFASDSELMAVIRFIVESVGRRVDT